MKLLDVGKALASVTAAIALAVVVVLFTGFSDDPAATRKQIAESQARFTPGKAYTAEELDRQMGDRADVARAHGEEPSRTLMNDLRSATKSSGAWVLIFGVAILVLIRPRFAALGAAAAVSSIILFLMKAQEPLVGLLIAVAIYILVAISFRLSQSKPKG